MDGILMDGRTGKLWMCRKDQGHVLGIILSTRMDDHFVDQLVLFRHAVLPEFVTEEGTVMATVEGTMHNIECDLCHTKRTWWMGEAALDRFMAARRARRTVRELTIDR
jgi:hypothetical protein